MINLYHRELGEGLPVLLLHGLFGSADNLGTLARALSKQYRVIAMDLRDHGRSAHSDSLTYIEMAEDVFAKLDEIGIEQASIFGHSMGGKVAMQMAALQPERVDKLVIGDIAPVSYPRNHDTVLKAQKAVQEKLTMLKTRQDALDILAAFNIEENVLSFLMTNFRPKNGGWMWRHNLDLIIRDYAEISKAPGLSNTGEAFPGPTLFVKGENSDYIQHAMEKEIRERFIDPQFKLIVGTGHWFHAEKPDITQRLVADFIGD